jgi:hypothetical protein
MLFIDTNKKTKMDLNDRREIEGPSHNKWSLPPPILMYKHDQENCAVCRVAQMKGVHYGLPTCLGCKV